MLQFNPAVIEPGSVTSSLLRSVEETSIEAPGDMPTSKLLESTTIMSAVTPTTSRVIPPIVILALEPRVKSPKVANEAIGISREVKIVK